MFFLAQRHMDDDSGFQTVLMSEKQTKQLCDSSLYF